MDSSNWFVYVLAERGGRRTYVGATVDPDRRLRQHNGQLAGGARATRGRAWDRVALVAGFAKRQALSFEWHLKHQSRRHRGSPLQRRLAALSKLLGEPRFSHFRRVIHASSQRTS